MLSIGRCLGSSQRSQRLTNRARTSDSLGAKQSNVVGNANRSSSTSSSCSNVVPDRQWPMMKIGGCSMGVRATRRSRNSHCTNDTTELIAATIVMASAMCSLLGETANRFRAMNRSQILSVIPCQNFGAQKG